MSRILALAFAATLLGVSACNKPAEESSQPVAAQPAPQTSAASAPADAMMAAPADEKAAMMASGAGKMSMPMGAMKAAPAAPDAAPEVKAEAPAASSGTLTQDQALALANKSNCLACHKIEKKVVGPAWKDVSAKYKGDKNAAATIASHIKSGGSFGWKFGVMPARGGSKISDADVDSLAKFIASLK